MERILYLALISGVADALLPEWTMASCGPNSSDRVFSKRLQNATSGVRSRTCRPAWISLRMASI